MQDVVPGGFITNVATVQQQVDESLLEERLVSILASLFGGLALLLAGIGLYGIMSFAVIRRTREIGIRIAVGAQRSAVLWLVVRNMLGLIGAGLALGIPMMLLIKRFIESELFGVDAGDPTRACRRDAVATGGVGRRRSLAGVAREPGGPDDFSALRIDLQLHVQAEIALDARQPLRVRAPRSS